MNIFGSTQTPMAEQNLAYLAGDHHNGINPVDNTMRAKATLANQTSLSQLTLNVKRAAFYVLGLASTGVFAWPILNMESRSTILGASRAPICNQWHGKTQDFTANVNETFGQLKTDIMSWNVGQWVRDQLDSWGIYAKQPVSEFESWTNWIYDSLGTLSDTVRGSTHTSWEGPFGRDNTMSCSASSASPLVDIRARNYLYHVNQTVSNLAKNEYTPYALLGAALAIGIWNFGMNVNEPSMRENEIIEELSKRYIACAKYLKETYAAEEDPERQGEIRRVAQEILDRADRMEHLGDINALRLPSLDYYRKQGIVHPVIEAAREIIGQSS